MAQQVMTVRVDFGKESTPRTYEGCAGINVNADSGIVTIISTLGHPAAVFLLIPGVVVETQPNSILVPERLTPTA